MKVRTASLPPREAREQHGRILLYAVALVTFTLSLHLTGCATTCEDRGEALKEEAPGAEEKWGIRVHGIRLTAAGFFLDFRYRVVDPDRASDLLATGKNVFLIHQETGKVLTVPVTKVGAMRSTAVRPEANRDYTVMFSNYNQFVKRGNQVTVVIGDIRIEDLTVQ